ncbi:MAG TPA: GMC family oxidoreductase N-terminal domain-containing protein [Candidatus Cybelea sp.]|nr:GMC family oxidoreductase N-terminal domain-containing protein [Candidatus Cybelea sp.]
MDIFDYIVVGAGSAGCVLANRLSADRGHKVLLLEAGPWDHRFWIQVPIGYGKTFYDGRYNWKYQTAPDPGLGGRPSYWPRGKVIGGSSSINAMVYVRGQAEDFDDWEKAGNPGWGWRDVLPVYRRMEDHALGESLYHGVGGPLHVTEISKTAHPLTAVFVEAGQEAGLAFNPDLNGATQEGVGTYQITTRNGFRLSSARAYLWPALWRPNLAVRTNALATRILFEGKRAVGVAYRYGRRVIEVRARREVILSGGAINSPQLLQLSGVGPAELLKAHGIAVVEDSPAVGQNLQDHLCYDHVYRAKRPSLNNDLYPWWGKVRAALRYLLTRGGPLSLSVNQGGGFIRSRADLARPDIQLYFSPLSYERTPPGIRPLMHPDPFPGFVTSVSPCRPKSRGHLAIHSADPAAAPTIVPNYLSHPDDIAELLAGARFLRQLAATPTLAGVIETELKPGAKAQSDEVLIADIRSRAYSVFHPCGSCAMGPDSQIAVVDHRLRVHGIGGLRVADASIFPAVTSGNINAPAIMVGEKAADLILTGDS